MNQNKREKQKQIRRDVEWAYALTPENLEWKPYYPNNMLQNGQMGWYCILQRGDYARKYTIKFQYHMDDQGATLVGGEVDRYILFEKRYHDLEGPLAYPEPSRQDDFETLMQVGDINDFGSFVYAHKTLEQAKKQALWSYQMVFGYAMSHLLEPEEDAP